MNSAKSKSKSPSPTPEEPSAGPSTSLPAGSEERIEVSHDTSTNTYHLTPIDPTSAGDNHTFLRSPLTWSKGEDGKERVLDEDGNGVMMGWEEPLMVAHVESVRERLKGKVERGEGISVLNIGFGLGIVSFFSYRGSLARSPFPRV